MLHKVEKAKIEKFKKENVSLKYDFKKKQSLVFKISILYLAFTILNLVLFWVAMGANQYSLLAENANEKARSLSLEFLQRLEPVRTNRTWAKSALNKKDEAFQMVVNLLRKKQGSEKLTTKSFHIVKKNNSNNDIQTLYSHDAESLEVGDAELRRQISTAIYKKSKGEPYFREISVLDYTIALYIPLQSSGYDTLLLLTRITIPKIKDALTQLFIIALGMLVIMLVVQTLFGVLIYSIVIKPIKQLADGASEVGQGNLDVEVVRNKKSDEIGLLIYSFNKMVTSLKEKTNKLEFIIEELERHNETMRNELDMAQNIQGSIMPKESLSDQISVGVYYGPLEKVSGDYYDIFSLPDGSVGVLITDTSGHGIATVLVTLMAKVHFSSFAESETNPGELFNNVNRELSKSIVTSDYLTAFYFVIHPDLSVDYCNASHRKAIIYHAQTGELEELDTEGFLIGAIEEAPTPYETSHTKLEPKDRIILYTDGIVEGTNPAGEEYGNERFNDKIKELAHLNVEEFNAEIMKDVDAFAAKEPRKDDYTLFTIEIEGASEVKVDLIKSGEKLYQEHKFAEAQEVFEKVLAIEPGNLTAKLYMANTLFFLKDYEKAKPFFEEYTAIKSTNPYAHFKLGVCYSKGGEEDKAIAQYENAIKINENLAEAHGQMAISYSNSGELDLAMQNLERALKLQPDDSRLHKIKDKIEQRMARG